MKKNQAKRKRKIKIIKIIDLFILFIRENCCKANIFSSFN